MSGEQNTIESQEPVVKSFDELKDEYDDAEGGSQEEAEILAKMAEVATTQEQWKEVYWDAEPGSELEARAKAEVDKFNQ